MTQLTDGMLPTALAKAKPSGVELRSCTPVVPIRPDAFRLNVRHFPASLREDLAHFLSHFLFAGEAADMGRFWDWKLGFSASGTMKAES